MTKEIAKATEKLKNMSDEEMLEMFKSVVSKFFDGIEDGDVDAVFRGLEMVGPIRLDIDVPDEEHHEV